MDLRELGNVVNSAGIIGLFAFSLFALHRGWWIPGTIHRDIVKERDSLREDLKTINNETRTTLNEVRRQQQDAATQLIQLSIENERLKQQKGVST